MSTPTETSKPAVWMFVTATSKTLHHFRLGRGRSTCGRYFRNREFAEAGLWWPVLEDGDPACWTCKNRVVESS